MFGLMYLLQACLIDGINELLIELKVGGGFTVYEYDLLGFGFSVFGLYLGVVFGSARSVLADLQQTAGPSAWYPKPEAEMATFYSEVRSPLCITCIQAHVLTTSIRACVMPHRTADFALKAQVHRSVSAPTPSITTDFPHPILPLFLAATRSARRAGPLAAASATATSTCAAPNRQQLFLSTACRFCLCALTAAAATISSMCNSATPALQASSPRYCCDGPMVPCHTANARVASPTRATCSGCNCLCIVAVVVMMHPPAPYQIAAVLAQFPHIQRIVGNVAAHPGTP